MSHEDKIAEHLVKIKKGLEPNEEILLSFYGIF